MIEIVETFDKSKVMSKISRDILQHCSAQWDKGIYFVLAGNYIYEVLLRENKSQRLNNGDTEFRRCQALDELSVLVINLQNLEAIKLKDYNV